MEYSKVQDKPDFVRDNKTGALLNTDNKALSAYKYQKQIHKNNNERLSALENKVDNIEDILKQILGKLT